MNRKSTKSRFRGIPRPMSRNDNEWIFDKYIRDDNLIYISDYWKNIWDDTELALCIISQLIAQKEGWE